MMFHISNYKMRHSPHLLIVGVSSVNSVKASYWRMHAEREEGIRSDVW